MSDFLGLLLARTARQLTAKAEPQGGLRLRPLSRFEAAQPEPVAASTPPAPIATLQPWQAAPGVAPEPAAAAGRQQQRDVAEAAVVEPRPQPQVAALGSQPQAARPVAAAISSDVQPPVVHERSASPAPAPRVVIAPLVAQLEAGPEQQRLRPQPQDDADGNPPAPPAFRPQQVPSPPAGPSLPDLLPQLAPLQPVWANAPQPLPLPVQSQVPMAGEAALAPVAAAPAINISIGVIDLADRRWPAAAATVASTPPKTKVQGLDAYLDSRSRHGRGGQV